MKIICRRICVVRIGSTIFSFISYGSHWTASYRPRADHTWASNLPSVQHIEDVKAQILKGYMICPVCGIFSSSTEQQDGRVCSYINVSLEMFRSNLFFRTLFGCTTSYGAPADIVVCLMGQNYVGEQLSPNYFLLYQDATP